MTDEQQILFGGYGPLPAKTPEFTKPEGRAAWVEILEQALLQLTSSDEGKQLYGDPRKGATLEQAWRTSGIFTGKWPVCLITIEQPVVATGEIEPLIKMTSSQLAGTLAELFETSEKAAFQLLYYDGHMGHSITLLEYDPQASRFLYHDPWPGDSLLCRDYNAAGVDAQRAGERWSITALELEKVIFAAFVYRPFWSEYLGETYYTTYEQLKGTDFWSFFHLSESGRTPGDDGQTRVQLRTGGFQSEIHLSVSTNPKDRLVEGVLALKRSWVVGPPYGLNPFALDIARSFLAALAPPPDGDAMAKFTGLLQQIQDRAYAEQLFKEGPEKSVLHKALFTYLGADTSVEAPLEYSTLTMNNLKREDVDWLEIRVTTDAL
jgi:hypothetical protein